MSYSTCNAVMGEGKDDILFRDEEHELFCLQAMEKCRWIDGCHEALVYCLGIDQNTRNHVDRIYDFATGEVKPDCLREEWQTIRSMRVVRMAFNLYSREATSQVDALARIFGDCREGQIPRCLHRRKFDAPYPCIGVFDCDGTPSVDNLSNEEDRLRECCEYTVSDLFCCGYARYFWEAVKIRYPEYCV
ncbi:MAG: DUF6075 family protein [Lachnospiraceae bacterium]|nr:DUF6075 family protein [Lachnospiraceae bacterium]